MRLTWQEQGQGIDVERVEEFESALGVRLPSDYREFLVSTNGGKPEPNYSTADPSVGVRHLAGIGPGENDLPALRESFSDRLPAEVLPIGSAPGGNLVGLSTRTGEVCFWDHEREAEDGEEPTWENLSVVSSSFTGFLDSLAPLAELPTRARVVSATFDPAKLKGNG